MQFYNSPQQAQQFISNYCLTSLRSSPDTILSRYIISFMTSYVSLPSCLLKPCMISALRFCWISGCSASSYRAKLIVLAEVSCPAIRNKSACATNKSPSISEKAKRSFVTVSQLAMSSCYVQVLHWWSLFLCLLIHYVLRIYWCVSA